MKKKNKEERGSGSKPVRFPKKKKKKRKKEAILRNEWEGRWVISHQTHSLPTFLSSFFSKLERKNFPLKL